MSALHPTDADETPRVTAEALVANWAPSDRPPHRREPVPLCAISTEENLGSGPPDLRIDFLLSDAQAAQGEGKIAPSLESYEMGVRSSIGTQRAYLWFSCESNRLNGSDRTPAYVLGQVEARSAPEGDEGRLKDANATLVHSASTAVARELGCAEGAGLGEKPVTKNPRT
ncbi:hypothetical protein ACF09C_20090 [Streptomyces sp. NPDC014870]|uniref:hypothetical protein n=1 Tax=Streptomyces sp. NPDC014870 TaxID=3364925 RepID=UPI0036F8CD63